MTWLLLIAAVMWYWWLLYTLSFDPREFPDPKYANEVWQRRVLYAWVLGAAIVTMVVFAATGLIRTWWSISAVFVAAAILATLAQPHLVGLVLYSKFWRASLRIKLGLESRPSFLALLAWTCYLTKKYTRETLASVRKEVSGK